MSRPGQRSFLCTITALLLVVTPSKAQKGFGSALAVSGDEIFIGEADNVYRSGVVYVFGRGGSEWEQRAEITAPDAEMGDQFGESIAVLGDRLIVGATGVEGQPGAAYIYDRQGPSWTHSTTLRVSDASPEDRFGRQVALAGDFAFVGAPGADEKPGTVYVFRRGADGSWEEHSTLQGSGVTAGSTFGIALEADDDLLFVGAPLQNEETGVVYLFEYRADEDAWAETSVLEGRVTEPGHRYGTTLDLAGNDLVIGIPQFANRIGGAMTYRRDAGTGAWSSTALLLPFAASSVPSFGSAVAAAGDEVWIGAPTAEMLHGAAYRFERSGEGWSSATMVAVSDSLQRGDAFGRHLAVSGDVAVVALSGDDYGAGSVAVFERDDEDRWIHRDTLRSSSVGLEPVTGAEVDCQGGSASLFECQRVDLLSFLPIREIGGRRGVNLNDIWGWTDEMTGKEYALVGRVDGTSFVDVTDPTKPVYLGDLPKTEDSPGSAWRDIKVYKDHAFIVADNAGEHGMQVFDLTQLRDFAGEPVTFDATAHYNRIHSAHNIVINTDTGFAYTVGNGNGGETCGGGLHMINIEDPVNPTFAGCYSAEGTGRAGTGYTHDAQCLVYDGPDADYKGRELCFGSNETALNISDVTDKSNPVNVATASYPNVSYTHQGWISEDHRYFYVNDELDELSGNAPETRTLIWDITDIDDPQLVKEYMWGDKSTDHNLYIRGNFMYQSNYASGLRIHDISDPENPVEVGYFDTMPVGDNGPGFAGSWSNYPFFESGTIAVSSIGEGLFLLRKREEVGL